MMRTDEKEITMFRAIKHIIIFTVTVMTLMIVINEFVKRVIGLTPELGKFLDVFNTLGFGAIAGWAIGIFLGHIIVTAGRAWELRTNFWKLLASCLVVFALAGKPAQAAGPALVAVPTLAQQAMVVTTIWVMPVVMATAVGVPIGIAIERKSQSERTWPNGLLSPEKE